MKAEVTEVAPCRKKIEIEIPAEKVDKTFDESYSTLRENVQLKGFRNGHAPRRLLERKFAKDVAKDVRAKLFQDALSDCMKENDLAPMGEPDLDIEKLEVKTGTCFAFSTEIDVRPKFDLPEYKGLTIEDKAEPVTDEDIERRVEELRENFADYTETDEKSSENDALEADILGTAGEEELINAKAQRVPVRGDKLFTIPCKDLVKKLSGKKAGDEVTLKLTLPDDFYNEALRGEKATMKLSVLKILRPELPELDQKFAQRFALDDMSVLRKRIGDNLRAERSQQSRQEMEKDIIDLLISKTAFDLPEEVLKRQVETTIMRSQLTLARQGATKEAIEEQKEKMEEESKEQTERMLRWTIISDSIADKEELEVTEQEMQMHIEMLAQSYQIPPAKMLKRIQDQNGLHAMVAEIRDMKVINLIMESVENTGDDSEKSEDKE